MIYSRTHYNVKPRLTKQEDKEVNINLDERSKKYWASKIYKKEERNYELTSSLNPRIP